MKMEAKPLKGSSSHEEARSQLIRDETIVASTNIV